MSEFLCPGYTCKPGAKLYGIVNSGGFIDYLRVSMEIDEVFVQQASKGREPEKRFRFAGNCAKSGCKQWDGTAHECGLIDELITVVGNQEPEQLQDCPIREKCRWFAQRKGMACAQCNEVIRNIEMKLTEV
ncbi:hypothetical protein [Pedobacter lusitanus]|uniref:hypothetical protein n=1 Tax=Pedobacter lusitanus TaxID=1503925 RepID=UPI0006965171|nr:hypothetical protein [Pedobacter lusitanus]